MFSWEFHFQIHGISDLTKLALLKYCSMKGNLKVLRNKAITHEGNVIHEKLLILHEKLQRKLLYIKNTLHEKLRLPPGQRMQIERT